MTRTAYLDVYIGHKDEHARAEAAYAATAALLTRNAAIYGLPPTPEELSDEHTESPSRSSVV